LIFPAAPPPLPEATTALLPEVLMVPSNRLPAAALPEVVKVTIPPAALAVASRVSIDTQEASIEGAATVISAPPVVIPVGFTAPIDRAY